jgi:hypothetical protein
MSRPRDLDIVQWLDDEGRTIRHRARRKRISGVTSIPRELRLVECYCPSSHLTAVLSPSGGAAPLVMADGSEGRAVPYLVLTEAGLEGAMVADGVVYAMGNPRASWEAMACPICVEDFVLDAAELRTKLRQYRGRPRGMSLSTAPPSSML